jgi:hypothetical protein
MKCSFNSSKPAFCSYRECNRSGSCRYPIRVAVSAEPTMPEGFQEKVGALNKELQNTCCFLIPYVQYCSEGPDEWHLQLMHHSEGEVCRHLRIENLNWHTLVMLLEARKTHGEQSFKAGGDHAVNKLAAHFKALISG